MEWDPVVLLVVILVYCIYLLTLLKSPGTCHPGIQLKFNLFLFQVDWGGGVGVCFGWFGLPWLSHTGFPFSFGACVHSSSVIIRAKEVCSHTLLAILGGGTASQTSEKL